MTPTDLDGFVRGASKDKKVEGTAFVRSDRQHS